MTSANFFLAARNSSRPREKNDLFLESFHLQKRVYRAFSRQYLHNLFMEIEREAAGEENVLKEMHLRWREGMKIENENCSVHA